MADVNEFAGVVALAIKAAMAPVYERVALMEAKISTLASRDQLVSELRERVVVAETKATLLVRPETGLDAFLIRMAAIETQLAAERDTDPLERRLEVLERRPVPTPEEIVAVRERVTAVETKASQSSPDVTERVTALESKTSGPSTLTLESVQIEVDRRLTALEQRPAPLPVTDDINALRDRIVAVETKAGVFESQLAAPDPLSAAVEKTDRAIAELSKDLGGMRERIAVVEVRPPVPGPKGEPGPPGKDGVDGKDGSAGLSYEGVYQEGQAYEKGMLVTWAGSSFHCNETTTSKPGESKAWTLMVKRGRDGKDFRDAAAGPPPVVTVGAGRG
jgi:hypothetical protein